VRASQSLICIARSEPLNRQENKERGNAGVDNKERDEELRQETKGLELHSYNTSPVPVRLVSLPEPHRFKLLEY
jgi:hypothetical protein